MLYLLIPLILVYQVFPLNLRCYIPSLHSLYYSTTLIHTPYQSIVYQVFPLNLRCCIVSQCRRDEMRIMTIRNWLVPPPPYLFHPCQHTLTTYPIVNTQLTGTPSLPYPISTYPCQHTVTTHCYYSPYQHILHYTTSQHTL